MISNILAGIFEPRTVRKYVGRHRAPGWSSPVPRPRAALEGKAPERTAWTARTAPRAGSGAYTDVTMELTPVPLPIRSATPPPR